MQWSVAGWSAGATARLDPVEVLTYPNRPIRVVVPAPPQGGADLSFELDLYYGLLAPKDTPREIIERVNLHVNRALESPRIQTRLASLGLDPEPASAESFGRKMRVDSVRWAYPLAGFTITPD